MKKDKELKKAEKLQKKAERIQKKEEAKKKRAENWEAFKEMQKNPAVVIAELTMLAAVIGCTAEGMKTVQSISNSTASIKNNKDSSIWDARNGIRIPIKSELNAEQIKEFDSRVSNGETAASVLGSMNLIK